MARPRIDDIAAKLAERLRLQGEWTPPKARGDDGRELHSMLVETLAGLVAHGKATLIEDELAHEVEAAIADDPELAGDYHDYQASQRRMALWAARREIA